MQVWPFDIVVSNDHANVNVFCPPRRSQPTSGSGAHWAGFPQKPKLGLDRRYKSTIQGYPLLLVEVQVGRTPHLGWDRFSLSQLWELWGQSDNHKTHKYEHVHALPDMILHFARVWHYSLQGITVGSDTRESAMLQRAGVLHITSNK